MTTRFYLPASGSAPVTPPALPSGWVDQSPAHYNAPAPTAKTNTALTDITVTDSTSSMTNVAVGCYVSDLLAAQSISGTVSAVVMAFASVSAADDSLNVGVYLIAGDGSSVTSTLYAGHTETLASVNAPGVLGQEFDSGQFETRIIPATAHTTQSAAAGDRLMILVGYRTHDVSATGRASSLRVGDPTGTADQALTADLTSNLVPWVELSTTLQFGADQPFDTLADTFDGVTGLWPNSYGGTAVTGGQAVVDCDAGQFSGFKSAAAYHLADSHVGGQFTPPAAAGGSSAYMSIIVTSTTAGTDATFNIDGGFVGVLLRSGFSDPGAVFLTYDPTDHAWLRFREDAGSLIWEASPDGASWSALRTETSPAWVDDPGLAFVVECKRADGTDNTGSFDNVNTFGGGAPETATLDATLPALTGALTAGAQADAALAATLPALTGSLTGEARADAAVDGTLPALTGSLAAEAHADAALTGSLPALAAAFTASIQGAATGALAAALPPLAGSMAAGSSSVAALAGSLPALAAALAAGVPGSERNLDWAVGRPETKWRIGAPDTKWQVADPASKWAAGPVRV